MVDSVARQEELTSDSTPGAGRRQEKSARGSWSRKTALDPRHRPQSLNRPASTVRREWARAPQEAHLLDEENGRYRRLTVDEIAILQGFHPEWFQVPGMTEWDRTSAAGDAVPPPLAAAVVGAVANSGHIESGSALEICAGAGGLASAAEPVGLKHVALFDYWKPAVEVLRTSKPWDAARVHHADVRSVDWSDFRGEIGLLSGGPPCQPWSTAGNRLRHSDERDLLGDIHELVAGVQPEAFVFENVPGLVSEASVTYLRKVLDRLRSPDAGLHYGAIAGLLEAADFGVPQRRRRVFIIGLRGQANGAAFRIFDKIYSARTHRSPHIPDEARAPWVTVGQALAHRPDPGGWRTWIHDEGKGTVGVSAAH